MYRRADIAALGEGKVLYLSGTPYEQGRQLGRGAAELIRENISKAAGLLGRVPGLDRERFRALTRRNAAWVAREYPELLDELRGVAEGAAVAYDDLLDLNINTDLAYAAAYAAPDCTQVLATGPATGDGKTYVGKTRDLTRGPLRHVLLHREYDDSDYRNEFQIAGQLTLPVGSNRHGVTLTTSGQWSPRVAVDLARADAAWHILNLQPILRRARDVGEVIALVRDQRRLCGMLLLACDGRRAAALEVTDREVLVFEPEDGLLVRTNHYLAPELRPLAPTRAENRGTYDRHARATELLRQRHGSIGMADILRVLSDHAAPPAESICRHGTGDGSARTCAAAVICPDDRRMWAIFGNPCEALQAVGRPGE